MERFERWDEFPRPDDSDSESSSWDGFPDRGRHRTEGTGVEWSPLDSVGSAVASRWRRAVERWSPAGLRGARTDPGRRGAAALIAAALIAAVVVAGAAWHGRPRPEPIGPVAVDAPPGAPTSSGGPSASAASLVVAVTGQVRRPGVVTVPAGSRVIDAVKAAGGSLPGADLAMLNLARKLADGELVSVGVPAPAGLAPAGAPAGAGAGGSTVVDLNTATLADLDTLPGVGPVLAQRILDWRTEHGRFDSVDQLGDVSGIGESRLAQLRDLVRV